MVENRVYICSSTSKRSTGNNNKSNKDGDEKWINEKEALNAT